jgi:TP901 family phage tail tape measure protein
MNVELITAVLQLKDELTPALDKAQSSLSAFGGRASAIGGALMPVSVAFAGVGLAGIKFATDLNASMANVATLIPGATERVAELKATVQDLAVETGKSTADLAGGLYDVVSAFGDSADTALILETNARAAAAGLATTQEAIGLTSAVTKGYGDTSAAAVQQVSDLALLTVRLGQTTFPELAASMGRVTPLATELKVSQEELFAVMATATGVTGNASEVSTQFRGILQSLMAPTDAMAGLLDSLGVASGQALIQQEGLHGAVTAIVGAVQETGTPIKDFIGSIEGQTLALTLAGAQSEVYADKLASMQDAAGAADEAFRAQTEGINAAGHSWNQLKQQAATALQELGDVLLPRILAAAEALSPLLDAVKAVGRGFLALPEPVQTAGVILAGLVAAAGPVLMLLGSLASAAAAIVPWFAAGTTGAALLTGALTVLTGPIGLVVGAVAGLTAAWMAWGDDIQRVVTEAYTNVKTWLWDHLEPVLTPLIALSQSIGEAFEMFGLLMGAVGARVLETVAGWVGGVITWLRDTLQPVFGPIGAAIEVVARVFVAAKDVVIGAAAALYDGVKTWMLDRFTAIVDGVKAKVDAVTGFFKDMYVAVVGGSYVPDMVDGIRDQFGRLQGAMVRPALDAAAQVSGAFRNLQTELAQIGPTLINALQSGSNALQSLFGSLGGALGKDGGDWLTKALGGGGLAKALGSFGGPLGALAGSAVGDLVSMVGGLFSGNDTKKAREQAAKIMGFGSLDGFYNAIRGFGEDGAQLVHEALNVIGKKDTAANNSWLREVQALFEAQRSAATEAAAAVIDGTDTILDQAARVGAALRDLPANLDFDLRTHVRTEGTVGGAKLDDLPGFERGTLGRYVNFGAGTPVMLHGRERVMTEAEGRAGGPLVVITGNTFNVRDNDDIDAIGDALIKRMYDLGIVPG